MESEKAILSAQWACDVKALPVCQRIKYWLILSNRCKMACSDVPDKYTYSVAIAVLSILYACYNNQETRVC